ncbi:MAG: hypothetical protein AAFV96_11535 [Pseudomonadota bacterium]
MRPALLPLLCAAGFVLAASPSLSPSLADPLANLWLEDCLAADPQGEPDYTLDVCDRALDGPLSSSELMEVDFQRNLALQMVDQRTAPGRRVEPDVEIEIRPRVPRL